MAMRTKKVRFVGVTPLLMHRETIGFEKLLLEWRQNPANAALQVKGDDRSPGWTWIGGVYHDGERVGIPSDLTMAMLRGGGSKVSTGKRGTFKRQTQSGLIVMEPFWPLTLSDGRPVLWKDIEPLLKVDDYEQQEVLAKKLGMELFAKRVPVGNRGKHMRVRPQFAIGWSVEGTITITDDTITDKIFRDIAEAAGSLCGYCDWRPSSPSSPGPFGRCIPTVK